MLWFDCISNYIKAVGIPVPSAFFIFSHFNFSSKG